MALNGWRLLACANHVQAVTETARAILNALDACGGGGGAVGGGAVARRPIPVHRACDDVPNMKPWRRSNSTGKLYRLLQSVGLYIFLHVVQQAECLQLLAGNRAEYRIRGARVRHGNRKPRTVSGGWDQSHRAAVLTNSLRGVGGLPGSAARVQYRVRKLFARRSILQRGRAGQND